MKKFKNIVSKNILNIVVLLSAAICLSGCEEFGSWFKKEPTRVFIIYSAGFNNLSSWLSEDIGELCDSYSKVKGDNHVVIFSHRTKSSGNYSTPNSPVIFELHKDKAGKVYRDTLLTMHPLSVSASSETLNEALSFIQEKYQEAEYSILFSSHGTGWTPKDYCTDPEKFDPTIPAIPISMSRRKIAPYWGVIPEDGGPAVKSFGVQNITSSSYHEMDITDMAEAFPMKMKTIIFDACFMGCVEVAYELRNVADHIIASQTEILADGMDYETMLSYVFNEGGIFSNTDRMAKYCENFYNYYNRQSNLKYRSATISLIECAGLENLAQVCKRLFDKYRTEIADLEGKNVVQRYYRLEYESLHKWFFDLEDILLHCNMTDAEKEELQLALDGCITYKAATERFISDIDITNHSGLSMYLPYKERSYLNNFYKTLSWNEATGLIE